MHQLECSLWLKPVWHDNPPLIKLGIDHNVEETLLTKTTEFKFIQSLNSGCHTLSIEFLNKTDTDTQSHLGLDKAVIVDKIAFFGISDPKFVWNGKYTPRYPQLWASQQSTALPEILTLHNYLGWNGIWKLEFQMPIFTWIHQIQDLGWIYQ
jgi:hypothetical protein